MDDLVSPANHRGSNYNHIVVRLAQKLDKADKFLKAIEWGTPSSPIGFCPWCDRPSHDAHTYDCALGKALKASAPIGDFNELISDVHDLQSALRLGSMVMYLDGLRRELDDTEMMLGRIKTKIEEL